MDACDSLDHLGGAATDGPIVVELGKATVLEGEMPQTLDALIDTPPPGPHVGKQFS